MYHLICLYVKLIENSTSVTCDQRAVCPGEMVTCTCTAGYSTVIAWSSDQLIGQNGARLEFSSVQQVSTRQNVSNSSTFAILAYESDVNGVMVLISELTFVVSTSETLILTCLNVNLQNSDSIIIPMSSKCLRMVYLQYICS